MNVAVLQGIACRSQAGAVMQTSQECMVTRVAGVENDRARKASKRQVTVLSLTQWQQACNDLGLTLPWTVRRANLLVSVVNFNSNLVGKQLKIGALRLLITGETDPCIKMDRQVPGLRQALTPDWRGGVCCQVLSDGRIRLGDIVEILA